MQKSFRATKKKDFSINIETFFIFSSLFYLPYIYKILQFKVEIMRLKKVNGEET